MHCYLSNNKKKNISLLIGPEGGFSSLEEKIIKSYKHVVPVKLFNRLIKAETAAIMAISIFNGFQKKNSYHMKDQFIISTKKQLEEWFITGCKKKKKIGG